MEQIPTAKEFLKKLDDREGTTWTDDDESICKAFVEFAKLHVEAALKAASKNARCCDGAIVDVGHTIAEAYVEEDSILNAYPLDNIK